MSRVLRTNSFMRYGLFVGLALILAGCGSGSITTSGGESGSGTIVSGVGTGGTGVVRASQPAPLTGITGLVGAIVFLDINDNQQADLDEPFAYTDQNGSYSLQADPAALAQYPLLLKAVAGVTIDKATGQMAANGYIVPLGQ
jgi:hypothetical protein